MRMYSNLCNSFGDRASLDVLYGCAIKIVIQRIKDREHQVVLQRTSTISIIPNNGWTKAFQITLHISRFWFVYYLPIVLCCSLMSAQRSRRSTGHLSRCGHYGHNSLTPYMVSDNVINIGAGKSLFPDCSRPLLEEPMFTNIRWGFVESMWGQFHSTLKCHSLKWVWKLLI